MVNWQRILWDLKRDYAHIAAIAREVGYNPKSLQKLANGISKHDIPYTPGNKLIELHKKYCIDKNNIGERNELSVSM